MFYIIDNMDKLSIFDEDKQKVEKMREFKPQVKGQYTIETDIVTAEELRQHPNKVIVDDIEIEIDVPEYDEDGNPIYEEIEEEITVIDYDEDGNPIGEHTEIIKRLVQKTHKEKITVKGLVLNPNYAQEEAQKERQRLDALFLTSADVERALYKAKQMDFDDLKTLISELAPQIDIKAISIEFRANNFYRGVEVNGVRLIDTVGALLGYSSADMDYLFLNKELPEKDV